jgi:RHS repeat-associated protein
MQLVGRNFSSDKYRYGFNGQEKSTEIDPHGNNMTAEFWQYDARLGRRWNVDPVVKVWESPYAAFANNPINNIDPNGADTINIIRTLTKHFYNINIGGGLDGIPSTKIPDQVTRSQHININVAEGNDVFRFVDIGFFIQADGTVTNTLSVKTLELNNPQTYERSGGHNVEGYIDDRYALAANVPQGLLKYYGERNPRNRGIHSAIAYQKDMPFVEGLDKTMNVLYTAASVYGIGRAVFSGVIGRGGSIFGARGGHGLLGEEGFKVGGYRIDLMYSNPAGGKGGGTLLSIKQMKPGGATWRWDYGTIHGTKEMRLHSTVRFYWNGTKYGSTTQRKWYPSTLKAPFFKTIK